MNEPAPVRVGDALDWLHEQGKRRSEVVPEFDVEETLRGVRAARTTGQDQPGDPQPQPSPATIRDIQELIDRLAAVTRKLRHPAPGDS